MTVIAAMAIDGAILMLADSQETITDDATGQPVLAVSVPKLQRLTQANIALGFSGAVDVGQDFGAWLHAYTFAADETWLTFQERACAEASRLNGLKRKNMELAHVQPTENDTANVLIVGYLNKAPNILAISSKGEATFHMAHPPYFGAIGRGENHVRSAKFTVEAFVATCLKQKLTWNEQLFRFVVGVGIQIAPQCALPLQSLKITEEAASHEVKA